MGSTWVLICVPWVLSRDLWVWALDQECEMSTAVGRQSAVVAAWCACHCYKSDRTEISSRPYMDFWYYWNVFKVIMTCWTIDSQHKDTSTVQYSTVQYSTVQCSAVQYSTVQYSTVLLYTVYSTVIHKAYYYTLVNDTTYVVWIQRREEETKTYPYTVVQSGCCSDSCIDLCFIQFILQVTVLFALLRLSPPYSLPSYSQDSLRRTVSVPVYIHPRAALSTLAQWPSLIDVCYEIKWCPWCVQTAIMTVKTCPTPFFLSSLI